ncbi:4-hydroxy-2-oxo-heptane-1,7-dioate aldolase (plasmid) [Caballeronia sp. SBC1]|uniref:HpcH/HpaI aldolase family protein n=1 Tax=unclassified Caballeronia TaxID=2646786 RepID=UPI0013E182C7|nr:4-hydroxy-2-oxo-heptane-1,7-dioate aldolase [Caballeronia sp. SBC2]QIN64068.1 4-hydroxy-2-oxo-heptane-1,7-dioate aldolase [Caballeronia sp. SBC1]
MAVRENTLKSILNRGGVVANGWLTIPSSFSAEVMAHQGFDSLVIDMQHGVIDYQMAVTMLQAISTTNVIPLARVPWNDPASIMKMLDAGAYGIICPMINSRDEAQRLVRACRYAPQGNRSFGPIRASLYAGSDYAQHANDTVVVMPMIETKEAVENIDDILSTPGIDGVYVGPADLSLTLGCTPKVDQTEEPVLKALETILAACKRHKVFAGLHNASSSYAMKMASQGWQFVTLGTDSRYLATRAAEEVAAMKKTLSDVRLPAY